MELISKISDSLYEINLGHVKCFVVKSPKGLILIDTGLPNSLNKIKIALASVQLDLAHIKYIFITHSHLDHIGSLFDIKQVTAAMVGINEKGIPFLAKVRLPRGHDPKSIVFSGLVRVMSLTTKLKPVKVDMLLSEGSVPEEFGINMTILSTPGHTDDSVSFYFPEDKVVIVGDMFNGEKDRLTLPSFYESKEQLLKSIDRIRQLDVNTICVSHGLNNTKDKIAI
ncbi:MAG: MBL fold metallo-hydrolase [Conexivisphaerales archaeon]